MKIAGYFCSTAVSRCLRGRAGWHSADTPGLAAQIDDAPPAIALLYVPHRKRRHFGSSQTATEQHGDDGAVAQPLCRRDVRRVQERLRLLQRQPVPETDTF